MVERDGSFPHLVVSGYVNDGVFARRGRGDFTVRPVEDRAGHGQRVSDELDLAVRTQKERTAAFDIEELESLGVVISIEGATGFSLKLESLDRMSQHHNVEDRRPKWTLLSVTPETDDSAEVAQVWVSDEYRSAFLKLFEQYLSEETKTGKPKNQPLVANIGRISGALVRDLWQSSGEPDSIARQWWEIWLRPEPTAIDLTKKYAEVKGATVAPRHLRLDNRHVMWIEAKWEDLTALPVTAVPVTEIRRPQLIDTITDLSLREQLEYTDDLAARVVPAAQGAPAACLLDTGVRRSHLLLTDSLHADDMHTVFDSGLTGDSHGHGTKMAGLALFGPLGEVLAGSSSVRLIHRLESVKFHVPDSSTYAHAPESYGVVTALAASAPEVVAQRRRAFCMAVTSAPDRPGEPSVWSASVDALAAGTSIGTSDDGVDLLGIPEDEAKRLFVVSAGNVREEFVGDYLALCDVSPIEDPAQAWNALVVGAHTELTQVPTDPTFRGWSVLADKGELSPYSRTSLLAGGAKAQWPIRPDICMEGGNVLTDGAGEFHTSHSTLSLMTTERRDDAALSTANATSAATAQAGRLAARAMSMYPSYWPETVRGLLPHVAEWTPAMLARVSREEKKVSKARMLRRYGWGVPTAEAVEHSAKNAVTMVVQDTFQPFTGPKHEMSVFRLHDLPWPTEVLEEIGDADVELRVTLSYFIEPSASRRGWRRRYVYASHGLRFELRRPLESPSDFVSRINRHAADEEGGSRSSSDADQWLLGTQQRHRGSLHQDIWSGYGAELAATGGTLAVHAVGGWWKNNNRKDRVDLPVRYGLLVSLRTAAQGVDLYEPIAVELGIPTEVAVIEIETGN